MSEIEQLRERVAELEAMLGLSAMKPIRLPGIARGRTITALLGLLVSRPFVPKAVAYETLFGGAGHGNQMLALQCSCLANTALQSGGMSVQAMRS